MNANRIYNPLDINFYLVDQFIKKITFDNLVRRSIENNISSNAGLVLSDESIIDDIKNRFDKHWQRVILATAYPETANNVNWHLRKK